VNWRTIVKIVTVNWTAKVICFGLAIALFVFYRMSTLEERLLLVPLTIQSDSLIPSSSYPQMIRVNLRGESAAIFSILESDIEVFVDMQDVHDPGLHTAFVQWRNTSSLQSIEPIQITVDPMEIRVFLDHRMTKLVPLVANLRGRVENGFALASYSLNPPEVTIEGPASIISGVSELFTSPIDLDGRRASFSAEAAVLNRDPLISVSGSGNSTFQAVITFLVPVRNLTNVPIAIVDLDEEFTAELARRTANVRLEGRTQNVLDNFRPNANFLSVNAAHITEVGDYLVPITADLNGALSDTISMRLDPEEVMLTVYRSSDRDPGESEGDGQ